MSAIALSWVAKLKVGNQTAKQLLQFYASHNFNRPGFEFKNKTLAEQLEVSERAIRDAHKLLIEKGLIKRIPQYGKDGSQLSTLTYLEIPKSFEDNFFKREGGEELPAGGGGTSCHPREELAATLNNNINNKKDNKSYCSPEDEQEGFNEYWNCYPRKQQKGKALKVWIKNKLYKIASAIIGDVKARYEKYWKFKQKEFIPMPATYLNGQGWEDELIDIANKDQPKAKESYHDQLVAAGTNLLRSRKGYGFI